MRAIHANLCRKQDYSHRISNSFELNGAYEVNTVNITIGVVADDLDGVLVRANGTVAAETPELALGGAFCCGVRSRLLFQRQEGYVVGDAQM